MFTVTWYELGYIEHDYTFKTRDEAESFYFRLIADNEIAEISDDDGYYDP